MNCPQRVLPFSLVVLFFVLVCSPGLSAQKKTAISANDNDTFAKAFATPQDSLKPWVYYYWISNNVSKEGITKDMEAMAKVGIGQALIGNIGLDDVPKGNVPILGEEWWQMTEHAIREGKRLGINVGLFNCPGWSQSGGPWVKTTEAMRYLVSTEITVEGGKKIIQKIPAAKDTFQDVRTIAFPAPKEDKVSIANFAPVITSSPASANLANLFDGDNKTIANFASTADAVTIDVAIKQFFTARSLVLHPAQKSFSADVELQVLQNGAYKKVTSFFFNRTNEQVNVGPVPYADVAIAFAEATGSAFRIILRNVRDGGGNVTAAAFADIQLTSAPVLERYAEKKLDKMFQTPLPLWPEYQWANQPEGNDAAMNVQANQVLDLSKNLSADGTLNWDAPAGKWVVMRIGVTPTGTTNSPSDPNAMGLEVDKMNRTYLENHFNAYIGKILERMPAEDRSALTHVIMDSYEMGPQNWTEGLAEDFAKKYGYDPIQWLPVLSGRIVQSADASNRFLWDLRRLIADRVAYDYVGGLRDISAKHGLRVWLENYGHWGFPSEFLMYGGQSNDIAGEFWNEGELGNIECRAASSAAHIYGHQKVYAESYTSSGKPYERVPAMLKKRGDWSFSEGINHVLLHLYIHQPYEDKTPGINAWFGTEFNRKNTWFEQSKNWMDYQRRCMFMLQQGQVVNDVAYFIGEDAPKMTGTRNPEIAKGYQYDYINAEVIEQRMTVKDGKLMLPDGMSYRLLVLPQLETMRPNLLRKIKQLLADGATILGPAPLRSPSLQNYPGADKEIASLAKELWGNINGTTVKQHRYGKGLMLSGVSIETAMAKINVLKDVTLNTEDSVLYLHRHDSGKDIYFITNQTDKAIDFIPSFRVSGVQPELFDPTTGNYRSLKQFTQQGGKTNVPLHMEPTQSFFIVFRKPAAAKTTLDAINFPVPTLLQIIANPWQVKFDATKRGPKQNLSFNKLSDWSTHEDTAVRYYSGTATYSNQFVLNKSLGKQKVLLQFDEVKDMAEVTVNGKKMGSLWCPPYQLDITEALKNGNNTITVEVVNTWTNRLIGDSRLPQAERNTFLSVNNFTPTQKLQPSGLIGEAKLLEISY